MNGGSQFARPALILVLVIVALSLFDRFLAQTEMAEVQRAARRAYIEGSRLLKEGHAPQSVELLRTAHVLVRQNSDYGLQLGNALLTEGKTDEALLLIEETLQRMPNDGRANLLAARLMVATRMPLEARAYYHRAIYGNWPPASLNGVAARLELVELLVRAGSRTEALPELISLEEVPGIDTGVKRRLAEYFRLAAAPARASAVYKDLIGRNQDDVEAWKGLGEAELDQGDYRAAREAFLKAFSLGSKASVLPRLSLVNTLTGLDPTPRQLPSLEKYRRSIRILALVREDAAQHPSGAAAGLLKEADGLLSKKEPLHVSNELAEEVLAVAEKLWQYQLDSSGSISAGDREPLRLIMKKLAAQA